MNIEQKITEIEEQAKGLHFDRHYIENCYYQDRRAGKVKQTIENYKLDIVFNYVEKTKGISRKFYLDRLYIFGL